MSEWRVEEDENGLLIQNVDTFSLLFNVQTATALFEDTESGGEEDGDGWEAPVDRWLSGIPKRSAILAGRVEAAAAAQRSVSEGEIVQRKHAKALGYVRFCHSLHDIASKPVQSFCA